MTPPSTCLVKRFINALNACVFSCQQGRYLVIATDFSPVAYAEVKDLTLGIQTCMPRLSFTTGYVGLISYDAFAQVDNPTQPVFWRIDGAIVIDTVEHSTWLTGTAQSDLSLCEGQQAYSNSIGRSPQEESLRGLATPQGLSACRGSISFAPSESSGRARLRLQPNDCDTHYLECVQRVISDISDGRYYLLNYLRFFAVQSDFDLHALLASKFINSSAPYKALLRWDDQAIYSFSPEQFVSIKQERLLCSPIKGTARRESHDHEQIAQALQHSEKDLAELHITIDLARNDIGAIADAIRVVNSGQVRSFSTVHHLVATLQAILTKPITLHRFLHAMCPAASISGAPKLEVMRAISEYETQPRGYFMGNIVCLDDSGMFDSSVLIRTVWSKGDAFTYAAGGGITLSSKPEDELREVETKTRVLLS